MVMGLAATRQSRASAKLDFSSLKLIVRASPRVHGVVRMLSDDAQLSHHFIVGDRYAVWHQVRQNHPGKRYAYRS